MLLIDETDKADEIEGLLLEVLSDFRGIVPELAPATRAPFSSADSNATRAALSVMLSLPVLCSHRPLPDLSSWS